MWIGFYYTKKSESLFGSQNGYCKYTDEVCWLRKFGKGSVAEFAAEVSIKFLVWQKEKKLDITESERSCVPFFLSDLPLPFKRS